MKKYLFGIGFASLVMCASIGQVFAQSRFPAFDNLEAISNFHTDLKVQKDGTLHVTETINYDFKRNNRYGIVRDIPLTDVVGTIDRMSILNLSVTDENDTPYMFTVSGIDPPLLGKLFSSFSLHSDVATIKIGNDHIPVSGEMTYVISYDVKNALGYFDDRTEIYWNTTGNHWLIPIKNASTQISIPQNQTAALQIATYCGKEGVTTECSKQEVFYDEKLDVTKVNVVAPGELTSGEGMTVAVGFPKGLVAGPTIVDLVLHYLFLYWGFALVPILVYFWFRKSLQSWWLRRKYYQTHTIVAEYDAGVIEPLEMSGIIHGYIQNKDISAQIIELAILGYVTIKKEEEIYSFKSTGKDFTALSESNKTLLQAIAGKTTADLEYTFTSTAQAITKGEMSDLQKNGYVQKGFGPRPMVTFGIALFAAFNPGLFLWFLLGPQAGIAFSGTAVLIAIISVVFQPRPQSLTSSGFEIERKLLGLRLYIEVAEEDRIKFHNAPEKSPELFEKLLPYAMVFGLEEKWAKEFDGIYTIEPAWYAGSDTTVFSTSLFASEMGNFTSTTASVFGAVKSSDSGSSFGSSGSSSGSSGGGFSGGGGGGGGGGSW
jgi:uncharacterized membrane protein YgcG